MENEFDLHENELASKTHYSYEWFCIRTHFEAEPKGTWKWPIILIIKLNNYDLFIVMFFRGILLAEEQRYSEAVQSYQSAIHFRPRLAGESNNACSAINNRCK